MLERGIRLRLRVAIIGLALIASGVGPGVPAVLATDDAEVAISLSDVEVNLAPELSLETWNDVAATASPGDEILYSGFVRYFSSLLSTDSTLTIENVGSGTATVEYLSVAFERRAVGQSTWSAIASLGIGRPDWDVVSPAPEAYAAITETAVGTPATGVEYSSGIEPVIGTTIDEDSTAVFALASSAILYDEAVRQLVDDQQTAEIRQVVHVEISPRDTLSGQPFSANADVTAVQAVEVDITDAEITFDLPTGADEIFDEGTTAALGTISPGDDSILVQTTYEVATDTGRGGEETVDDYIARLRAWNSLLVDVRASGTVGTGTVNSDATQATPLRLPIVVLIDKSSQVAFGDSIFVTELELSNVGGASTATVDAVASLPDVIGDLATVSPIEPATSASASIAYDIPPTYPEGSVSTSVAITWTDAAANDYGPIPAGSDVWISNSEAGGPTNVWASGPMDPTPLFGTESIFGFAQDETMVTSVELLVDGVVELTATEEPYGFELDTTEFTDGAHTYQIRAHDGDDHQTTSEPQPIHVDNALPSDLRVQSDAAKGLLSSDEAALLHVKSIVDPDVLPTRYQADVAPANYGTDGLMTALKTWNDLEPQGQEDIVAYLDSLDDDMSAWGTGTVLMNAETDFNWHCFIAAPCTVFTDHFVINYAIDPNTGRAVEMVDSWQLDENGNLETDCGECNGVPDWIDRLAYGFEQSWATYNALGYSMPGVPVIVNVEPSVKLAGIEWRDLGGRALSLGTAIWVPYLGNISKPIYIARHEFFHTMQAMLIDPDSIGDIPAYVARLAALVSDPTADPRWLLEATAEWGAHQAEAVDDDDWEDSDFGGDGPAEYAVNLTNMLDVPERWLAFADGGTREYGAFVLPEFIEEWAAGADAFRGRDPIIPVKGIVRQIWVNIGDDQSSLVGIQNALEALTPASSFDETLPAFARANYLLNMPGDPLTVPRIAGTYRDEHAATWRTLLGDGNAKAETKGDPDVLGRHISVHPRPGRRAIALDPWFGFQATTIQPGGASYLEFKLPGTGGKYSFTLSETAGVPVRATIMAFSAYPEPCAADTDLGLITVNVVTIYLPDACTAATVVLSHVDPFEEEAADVGVVVSPELVDDTFERTVASGWGVVRNRGPWRGRGAVSVAGEVSGGAGRLDVDGVNGTWMAQSFVTDLLAVGHFTDCSNADDQVIFDVRAQISITAGGDVRGANQSPVSLPGFDPCEPWFVRLTLVEDEMTAKVWQATDDEPEDAQVSVLAYDKYRLEIDTIGVAAGPSREFVLDWMEFEVGTCNCG